MCPRGAVSQDAEGGIPWIPWDTLTLSAGKQLPLFGHASKSGRRTWPIPRELDSLQQSLSHSWFSLSSDFGGFKDWLFPVGAILDSPNLSQIPLALRQFNPGWDDPYGGGHRLPCAPLPAVPSAFLPWLGSSLGNLTPGPQKGSLTLFPAVI